MAETFFPMVFLFPLAGQGQVGYSLPPITATDTMMRGARTPTAGGAPCPFSLRPLTPFQTKHAASPVPPFPKGNPYLTLRDQLGTIFQDDHFADLYSDTGQPGLSPWRLAWVTILQFRESLSDRQAAEAVRARIDWKYLLGLDLTDCGFDFSVLSEFRGRLLAGSTSARLLDRLLACCQAQGLLKARGRQRADSTHVLAAIRTLNRLELVSETMRGALNELARVAPDWLQGVAPHDVVRTLRQTNRRQPHAAPAGQTRRLCPECRRRRLCPYSIALDSDEAPVGLRDLPLIDTLRRTWQRHYERLDAGDSGDPVARFKTNRELSKAAEALESPYDIEARYRRKSGTHWTGYMVHVAETCDPAEPHLLTHVHTTSAAVHEARCTDDIGRALADKALAPRELYVDAAYVSGELLAKSREAYAITLRGPTRPDPSWHKRTAGAYGLERFAIDWERQQVRCPEGKTSVKWVLGSEGGHPFVRVRFSARDCGSCTSRPSCTRAKQPQPRQLGFLPRQPYEALRAAQAWYASNEGRRQYARRAGVEGTLSQGIRAFGMRRSRYRGLAKTHLQNVAIASAINLDRLVAWLDGRPRALTRTSRLAMLAPACATRPG